MSKVFDWPTFLEDAIKSSVPNGVWDDLTAWVNDLVEESWRDGYNARTHEAEAEIESAYNEGFDQGHEDCSKYYESQIEKECADAYNYGYNDGYEEGLQVGAEEAQWER